MQWTKESSAKLCENLVKSGLLEKPWLPEKTAKMADGLEKRFLKKVTKTRTCWIWNSALITGGYGCLWLRPKNVGAHRISYVLHKGPIPEGLSILHSCDVRRCVNPAHLRPGTLSENSMEMFRRGRGAGFAKSGYRNRKLSDDQIRGIRATSGSYRAIARIFNISPTAVAKIKKNVTWKDVQ